MHPLGQSVFRLFLFMTWIQETSNEEHTNTWRYNRLLWMGCRGAESLQLRHHRRVSHAGASEQAWTGRVSTQWGQHLWDEKNLWSVTVICFLTFETLIPFLVKHSGGCLCEWTVLRTCSTGKPVVQDVLGERLQLWELLKTLVELGRSFTHCPDTCRDGACFLHFKFIFISSVLCFPWNTI